MLHTSPAVAGTGRRSQASLVFAKGGGKTVLTGQVVPYPFHITRLFQLHPQKPDLATLFLQSASGGLYRADRLGLDIEMRGEARAHVTTQSATVVHDTGASPARQETRLDLASGSLLALQPDPLVLFPGAALELDTRIVLDHGARAVVTESFASHDPRAEGRPFESVSIALDITDRLGQRLMTENAFLSGEKFAGPFSPLGAYRAYGSMLILAPEDVLPDINALHEATSVAECLGGASRLPNGVGLSLRLLASDGGRLARGLEAAFVVAYAALAGVVPGRRRK
ncbi:urease accessory protein UreD [Methylobacterium gnaphalii]|uniref:Urease accessory protein UreD n=1 Tax=Methylobacterium gnaphalii TaxID=1010610 RepID=A0A512JQ22_9HYPH|nr:urease accessory protein UreD [Methylobacterium gnaphalii]GEP12060.1 urease accessory protein UreD [Methylobacterium gnaphalii]GJD70709.1 Urease accessory protein UreD [Methylobacterium gnaphalii]GLS48651.1 urease accessory protein UreD [Methylobacterium gnaphalii]